MKIDDIKRVSVIGAGMMGSQIAEILSRIGEYRVNLMDINNELVIKGLQAIDDRLEQFFVSKGKITAEEKESIIARLSGSTNLVEAVMEADFVVESVSEVLALKKEIFAQLDASAPSHAILTSNTSLQSISEMAAATKRPEKVAGMHFFNPVNLMRLVEVVKGPKTSDETVEMTCALAKRLGKEPVVCWDSYGFLANRAYRAMIDEAVQMVWERVASPGDIDKTLRLGYNLPVGPLELGDMVGSWATKAAAEQDSMRELGPEKGKLHPLIRRMVRLGYTGGSDKKGIYAFWDEVLSKP